MAKNTKFVGKDTAPIPAGVATCWIGNSPVFGFGDGKLLINGARFFPHTGGILALAPATQSGEVITCGDDGCVIATNLAGDSRIVWSDPKCWLDGLAYHDGKRLLAIGAGRDVCLINLGKLEARPRLLRPARGPNALAFSGDGQLLAVAHSGGISLFKVDEPDAVWREIPCSGGPVSIALDTQGDFLFVGLSEPALAGWRLADGKAFRMGGYPGKPRQLVWHDTGKALLTSGGPALLAWPMMGKDGQMIVGPMGQEAGVYRPRLGLLTALATAKDQVATGWSDGGVDLVNLVTGASRHISGPKPPKDITQDPRALTSGIVSVAFRNDGKQMSWISERGVYGTAAVQ
jgi:hypothetical protein